jgi:hypothetical protein
MSDELIVNRLDLYKAIGESKNVFYKIKNSKVDFLSSEMSFVFDYSEKREWREYKINCVDLPYLGHDFFDWKIESENQVMMQLWLNKFSGTYCAFEVKENESYDATVFEKVGKPFEISETIGDYI